jgi:hypothetical protein
LGRKITPFFQNCQQGKKKAPFGAFSFSLGLVLWDWNRLIGLFDFDQRRVFVLPFKLATWRLGKLLLFLSDLIDCRPSIKLPLLFG